LAIDNTINMIIIIYYPLSNRLNGDSSIGKGARKNLNAFLISKPAQGSHIVWSRKDWLKTVKYIAVLSLVFGLVALVNTGCAARSALAQQQDVPEQSSAVGSSPEANPVPITSAEGMVGTFRGGYNGDTLIRFGEDGTYHISFGSASNPEEDPTIVGSYRFENGVLFMEDTQDSMTDTCVGIVGSYEVARSATGRIKFTLVEDNCTERASDLAENWVPAG
jgi:hypothetical protein